MAYDTGLVERVDDALRQIHEIGFRQKNVFSGRGFLRGKSTFVIVWRESLLVKTPQDEYAKLLEQKESCRLHREATDQWERGWK